MLFAHAAWLSSKLALQRSYFRGHALPPGPRPAQAHALRHALQGWRAVAQASTNQELRVAHARHVLSKLRLRVVLRSWQGHCAYRQHLQVRACWAWVGFCSVRLLGGWQQQNSTVQSGCKTWYWLAVLVSAGQQTHPVSDPPPAASPTLRACPALSVPAVPVADAGGAACRMAVQRRAACLAGACRAAARGSDAHVGVHHAHLPAAHGLGIPRVAGGSSGACGCAPGAAGRAEVRAHRVTALTITWQGGGSAGGTMLHSHLQPHVSC